MSVGNEGAPAVVNKSQLNTSGALIESRETSLDIKQGNIENYSPKSKEIVMQRIEGVNSSLMK